MVAYSINSEVTILPIATLVVFGLATTAFTTQEAIRRLRRKSGYSEKLANI
ncbi:hypothetical protein [Synechococcus sp. PCC 7336]|uniref:hypothetical protein n=1 Tax=Synechococcus sp. PCC 7336 TaxID=195250 RepID=UPI00034787DE|nr:hypothetical protein [Synechococcus sp. PCC 7336]